MMSRPFRLTHQWRSKWTNILCLMSYRYGRSRRGRPLEMPMMDRFVTGLLPHKADGGWPELHFLNEVNHSQQTRRQTNDDKYVRPRILSPLPNDILQTSLTVLPIVPKILEARFKSKQRLPVVSTAAGVIVASHFERA
jgi:hypothetical protein